MSAEAPRPGDAASGLRESIVRHARYSLGREWRDLSARERFNAVALAVRDRLVDGMLDTQERYRQRDPKTVSYLSIEFMMGKSLGSALIALGIREACREVLRGLGADLDEIEESEPEAALGNGGLGRLAACVLDSLATLGMPGYGYGINYEYGLFKQEIEGGAQREKPDNWLSLGTPWEIARPDDACVVPLYGRIERGIDRHGDYNPMWMDWKLLVGVPHDLLVAGHGGRTVHVLRLYSARSSHDFDMRIFNDGDYFKAVEQKVASETISKILYPSDAIVVGQELRLTQEYFLVACAIRDIVRRYERDHLSFRGFATKVAIQLNDTHPALAVVELQRLLVDEKDMPWDEAWEAVQATFGYTNHTLLPEALETWQVSLLERLLPRHLEIIYEINRRLMVEVTAARPGAPEARARVSLIEESLPKHVRMANLAVVGSHSINGVSAIHSGLLRTTLLADFYELWPERFSNKTNGITQRRWLLQANPRLARLISGAIGDGWISDLSRLRALDPFADDAGFQAEFRSIKRSNKERLAALVRDVASVHLDPDSLFDVQVKRIHAYKRQLLNVLHVVDEYLSLIEDGRTPRVPRSYVFAGKAAPGYVLAKHIIEFIHEVARVIDGDPRATGWIRIAFIPDYRVSLAEKIIPAADLSEQISTAGTEASGTGNMKLALNGAVTMGTLDGANIEILEEVGAENMFVFGRTAQELKVLRERRSHRPRDEYDRDPRVHRAVDALRSKVFCAREPELFASIHRMLLDGTDDHFHVADLASYLAAQAAAGDAFGDVPRWSRMAIATVARVGRFSIDRTVAEYARDIWHIERV